MFSEFNTQPDSTSVNASMRKLPNASHHSRPRRLAKSYLVRLFHSLPFSGLRRRTLTPFLRFQVVDVRFGLVNAVVARVEDFADQTPSVVIRPSEVVATGCRGRKAFVQAGAL